MNMRLILGSKGSGKTTKAIGEANLLDKYSIKVAFIVSHTDYEKVLREMGLNKNIPVYSVYGAKSKDLHDYILIFEELECILRSMFRCQNICVTADGDNSEFLKGFNGD